MTVILSAPVGSIGLGAMDEPMAPYPVKAGIASPLIGVRHAFYGETQAPDLGGADMIAVIRAAAVA